MAPITAPQLNYLADLAAVIYAKDPAKMLLEVGALGDLTKDAAKLQLNRWIPIAKAIKAGAKATAAPLAAPKAIPAGTYLAMGQIVKVKIGKKTGAPYLIAEDGTYLGALKGDAPAMLAEIEADPKAAAIAYGKKTGNCCICSKTLTNPDSIAAGIGPVCAGKF